MQITYIETNAITNEVLRAYAGAHRLCVGYPDGVPETWRDVAPVKQEGDEMADLPMKHFTDETRARIAALEARAARLCPACGNAGGAGGGAAYPEHELDPAALLGPAAEPVDWPDRDSAGDEEC